MRTGEGEPIITSRDFGSAATGAQPKEKLVVLSGTRAFARRYLRSPDEEAIMGFGRGALLWMLGIPLPIILLLALFMHH